MSDALADLIWRTLAAEAGIDPTAATEPAAEIGSAALPIGSMAYVQALIGIEDQLGVAFADRLFAEVRAATVADVVRYARTALAAAAPTATPPAPAAPSAPTPPPAAEPRPAP